MNWEYALVPTPDDNRFSEAALDEMRVWWDRHPTYRRPDGNVVLCLSEEYRDRIVANGTRNEPDFNVEVISFCPERIGFHIVGWQENIDRFYDFTVFCQSRWSCQLLDTVKRSTTAEKLRDEMHAAFDYPTKVE